MRLPLRVAALATAALVAAPVGAGPTPERILERAAGAPRRQEHRHAGEREPVGAGFCDQPRRQRIDERDTGIAAATKGSATARILRLAAERTVSATTGREFFFLSLLQGRALLRSEAHGTHTLECDDACVLPRGTSYALSALEPIQALEVAM